MCQNSFINYCSRYFYFRFHGSFLVRLLDSQVLTHRQNSLELTMNCLVLIVFKGRIEKKGEKFCIFLSNYSNFFCFSKWAGFLCLRRTFLRCHHPLSLSFSLFPYFLFHQIQLSSIIASSHPHAHTHPHAHAHAHPHAHPHTHSVSLFHSLGYCLSLLLPKC